MSLAPELERRLSELEVSMARFDAAQAARGYSLPALILRSESSSSSQIERLTSSVRNVALAELSDKAPSNARLIAGNVAAMRAVLAQEGPLSIDSICAVHDELMRGTGEAQGLREEQVWIGGTPYSPHGALFVPPHPALVASCMDDLVQFAQRNDVSPVAKAALFHAQFETIHPFADGNGRTGRALLHRVLANDEALLHSALPISAGLLYDVDAYMHALDAYHEGEAEPIVERLADAIELAIVVGARIASDVDAVLGSWRELITDRADSASHRLPALLVEQPVVDTGYVARGLGVSDRTARTLVDVACERGILAKIGSAQRGVLPGERPRRRARGGFERPGDSLDRGAVWVVRGKVGPRRPGVRPRACTRSGRGDASPSSCAAWFARAWALWGVAHPDDAGFVRLTLREARCVGVRRS